MKFRGCALGASVACLLAMLAVCPSLASEKPADPKPLELHLGDGKDWHFLGGNGPWTESEGMIFPPNERNLHSRAFCTESAFSDFDAEFEFNANYRELGTGAAALVLRATDANHGYMVYFPWGGQQLRAKHFWAQLMKVDGDGYLRSLRSAWVPGVPSETDRWYKVRVEAKGPDDQRLGRRPQGVERDGRQLQERGGWFGRLRLVSLPERKKSAASRLP